MIVVLMVFLLGTASQAGVSLPSDVRAACDQAYAIVTRTDGIRTRRSVGSFKDETFRAPIAGCRIEIDGSFKKAAKSGAAAERLRAALDSAGWIELPEFSADGHDGTSFAFRRNDVACFARGSWDGGADDEPGIPPADPYRVVVICGKAQLFVRP
jgi:hypothetical protein